MRRSENVAAASADGDGQLTILRMPSDNNAEASGDANSAVEGRSWLPQEHVLNWAVEDGAAPNYRRLGKLLATCGGLYRHHDGHALIQVLSDRKTRLICRGSELAPVIVDRVQMVVTKGGKVTSELPAASHLNAMLRSEAFLGQFLPVDEVTTEPFYLSNFWLARPGYYDGGQGWRALYLGPDPEIANTTETIQQFLGVMHFATQADRTNTVAAALTVLLHRHWPGQKPVILVTATKSHSGKGTVTEFFRGGVSKADVLYESVDWPMQSQFQHQVRTNPDIGLLIFDNVRCDSAGGRATFIRSGFIESFVTTAEITLASPGAGEPIHLHNRYVVTINTNDGKLSPDLLNRALPIHLAPNGNVQDRKSPIGNPKLEFLPRNRHRISAELRGMIERWKVAGQPLNTNVSHSMTPWAQTIGGILQVNGFEDFLLNWSTRMATDDPVQEALAILGTSRPGEQLLPSEWAKLIVDEGLAKTLLPPNERDTANSRTRATGVVFKKHLNATFFGHTETKKYQFRLEGGCRRWVQGKNPHVRYAFTILEEESLPEDDDHILAEGGKA